jgi:hypothetical protein
LSYYTELDECDGSDVTIVANAYCNIEMATFMDSPFTLSVGEEIVAAVIATNAFGDSTQSADSSSGATYKTLPSAPGSSPTLNEQTETSITVDWATLTLDAETGGSTILSYNLVYDEGSGDDTFVSLLGESPYSTATTYQKGGLTTDTVFEFKYRAYNKYGWSDYSPSIEIRAATVPDQVDTLNFSVQDDTFVRISWDEPADGGNAISSYTIVIRENDDSTFSTETTYCDGADSDVITNTYCDIPFTTLRDVGTFSLELDDVVIAKVLATNDIGSGDFSTENASGVTI